MGRFGRMASRSRPRFPVPEAPNLGSVHLNRRPISLRFLLASCAAEDFKREVRRSFAEFAETHSALTMKQTATAALIFCLDRKSTRLNSSHLVISYAVFCLKQKK